jgi:hypothetical protein
VPLFSSLTGNMARKIGQIIRRGRSTSLVRIYVGRDPEFLAGLFRLCQARCLKRGHLTKEEVSEGFRCNCR